MAGVVGQVHARLRRGRHGRGRKHPLSSISECAHDRAVGAKSLASSKGAKMLLPYWQTVYMMFQSLLCRRSIFILRTRVARKRESSIKKILLNAFTFLGCNACVVFTRTGFPIGERSPSAAATFSGLRGSFFGITVGVCSYKSYNYSESPRWSPIIADEDKQE